MNEEKQIDILIKQSEKRISMSVMLVDLVGSTRLGAEISYPVNESISTVV